MLRWQGEIQTDRLPRVRRRTQDMSNEHLDLFLGIRLTVKPTSVVGSMVSVKSGCREGSFEMQRGSSSTCQLSNAGVENISADGMVAMFNRNSLSREFFELNLIAEMLRNQY
jgi:hypothetical protein